MIELIDVVFNVIVMFSSLWIIRQTAHSTQSPRYALIFRYGLIALACSCCFEILESLEFYDNEYSSFTRDGSLALLFITLIGFHKKRFGKL